MTQLGGSGQEGRTQSSGFGEKKNQTKGERELILVQENKTWLEALKHCRDHHADLPSLLSETEQLQAQSKMKGAQTDHVWTGLRFHAGYWLWVNGDALEYQAGLGTGGKPPQCPGSYHCGTLAKEEEYWGIRDSGMGNFGRGGVHKKTELIMFAVFNMITDDQWAPPRADRFRHKAPHHHYLPPSYLSRSTEYPSLLERFEGAPARCKGFLLQCYLYFARQTETVSGRDRVATVISALTGRALDCGAAVGPEVESYERFLSTLFDHSVEGREGGERLLRLRQGSRTASEFAREFRTIAASTRMERVVTRKYWREAGRGDPIIPPSRIIAPVVWDVDADIRQVLHMHSARRIARVCGTASLPGRTRRLCRVILG
eukprot:XP_014007291.1 PREDICTED: uncharacterized protein LOC106575333 [Salmo salar]